MGDLETYFIHNKKELFERYKKKKEIYKTHITDFQDIYNKGKIVEKRFYKNTLEAVYNFILHTQKIPVILFDIDDTFVSKSIDDNNIDYIRPSFACIINQIRHSNPNVIFGTLSQRRNGPPISTHTIFDSQFIICSHGYNTEIIGDNTYAFQDGSYRPIYVEKINAYIDTCKKHPSYSFFLIDDILSNDKTTNKNPLVSNGYGYTVKKEDKFTATYQLLGVPHTIFSI